MVYVYGFDGLNLEHKCPRISLEILINSLNGRVPLTELYTNGRDISPWCTRVEPQLAGGCQPGVFGRHYRNELWTHQGQVVRAAQQGDNSGLETSLKIHGYDTFIMNILLRLYSNVPCIYLQRSLCLLRFKGDLMNYGYDRDVSYRRNILQKLLSFLV